MRTDGKATGTDGDRRLAGMTTSDDPAAIDQPLSSETPAEFEFDRILTIPNIITAVRLLCLPIFWWLLFSRRQPFQAALLLGALGATDWVDGFVARRYHQVSNFGKIFDPTADRLLFMVGIAGIMFADGAPRWLCWVVLGREVVVGGTTVIITALGSKPVSVTWFGKAGAFCLMFAFPLFLGGSSDNGYREVFNALAWMFAVPGVVLSYYAAARYVPEWRVNLAEARAERAPA